MIARVARSCGRLGARTAIILLAVALISGATYALSISPASAALTGALGGARGGSGEAGRAPQGGAQAQPAQGQGAPQGQGGRGQRPQNATNGTTAQPQGGMQPAGQPGGGGDRNQISLARGGAELARNLGIIAGIVAVVVIVQSAQRALRTHRRRAAAAA